MDATTDPEPETHEEPVAPVNEYVAFIQQIELERIWLRSSRITNSSGGDAPNGAEVHISDTATWKESETGFQAFQKYVAEFVSGKKKLARVEVEFVADYSSEDPMNDELFALFEENNLPLNTWPYFREYLASVVHRMHWLPFTLPTRKFLSGPRIADRTSDD